MGWPLRDAPRSDAGTGPVRLCTNQSLDEGQGRRRDKRSDRKELIEQVSRDTQFGIRCESRLRKMHTRFLPAQQESEDKSVLNSKH